MTNKNIAAQFDSFFLLNLKVSSTHILPSYERNIYSMNTINALITLFFMPVYILVTSPKPPPTF